MCRQPTKLKEKKIKTSKNHRKTSSIQYQHCASEYTFTTHELLGPEKVYKMNFTFSTLTRDNLTRDKIEK